MMAPSPLRTLNESPSEKEGKYAPTISGAPTAWLPSMKVPPKRKGNAVNDDGTVVIEDPQ